MSHASKVVLKTLQVRLQQYMKHELPDVPFVLTKGRGRRDQIANIYWIIQKAREFQKNIYFSFINYAKAFDCVDHKKTVENSSSDGNNRLHYLPPEKYACRSRSNMDMELDMEQQTGYILGKEYIKLFIVTLHI